MMKRLIALFICFSFITSNVQSVFAQDFNVNQLPLPGTMVGESVAFTPLALKGLVINPQKPLEFQFIVDTGRGPRDVAFVKEEANHLVRYFLAGLTIPESDLWVNLSPYEKDRITTPALGQTSLGRDLLAQDYILKQLTASLIYPEKDLGKKFWSRVYQQAQEKFATTNVPVNTFNKVWILPDVAQVFENGTAAYVTKSTLKVMLDEDYVALNKNNQKAESPKGIAKDRNMHTLGSQIVRQIILPEIEKEVNIGKNFAPLRQIYEALILAKWYKETIANGLLDAVYTNKKKISGINLTDPAIKKQIYDRYLQAYKKGVFNYIKEDSDSDGQVVSRKYFSGGTLMAIPALERIRDRSMLSQSDGAMTVLTVSLIALGVAAASGIRVAKIIQNRRKLKKELLEEKQDLFEPVKVSYPIEHFENRLKEDVVRKITIYSDSWDSIYFQNDIVRERISDYLKGTDSYQLLDIEFITSPDSPWKQLYNQLTLPMIDEKTVSSDRDGGEYYWDYDDVLKENVFQSTIRLIDKIHAYLAYLGTQRDLLKDPEIQKEIKFLLRSLQWLSKREIWVGIHSKRFSSGVDASPWTNKDERREIGRVLREQAIHVLGSRELINIATDLAMFVNEEADKIIQRQGGIETLRIFIKKQSPVDLRILLRNQHSVVRVTTIEELMERSRGRERGPLPEEHFLNLLKDLLIKDKGSQTRLLIGLKARRWSPIEVRFMRGALFFLVLDEDDSIRTYARQVWKNMDRVDDVEPELLSQVYLDALFLKDEGVIRRALIALFASESSVYPRKQVIDRILEILNEQHETETKLTAIKGAPRFSIDPRVRKALFVLGESTDDKEIWKACVDAISKIGLVRKPEIDFSWNKLNDIEDIRRLLKEGMLSIFTIDTTYLMLSRNADLERVRAFFNEEEFSILQQALPGGYEEVSTLQALAQEVLLEEREGNPFQFLPKAMTIKQEGYYPAPILELNRIIGYDRGAKIPDKSMLVMSDVARISANNGGIDLDSITIKRTGDVIHMQFDQAQLKELMQGGFEGFSPVITDFQYIQSSLLLLGLHSAKEPEAWAKVI